MLRVQTFLVVGESAVSTASFIQQPVPWASQSVKLLHPDELRQLSMHASIDTSGAMLP
jgi:hypothetical protein